MFDIGKKRFWEEIQKTELDCTKDLLGTLRLRTITPFPSDDAIRSWEQARTPYKTGASSFLWTRRLRLFCSENLPFKLTLKKIWCPLTTRTARNSEFCTWTYFISRISTERQILSTVALILPSQTKIVSLTNIHKIEFHNLHSNYCTHVQLAHGLWLAKATQRELSQRNVPIPSSNFSGLEPWVETVKLESDWPLGSHRRDRL